MALYFRPRTIHVPGSHLKNIHYVRSYRDANNISEISVGKKVVILGSSFIAMEAASFLKNKANNVTVVGRSRVPFENILGNEIGSRIMALFESKGVVFHMNHEVERFQGNDEQEITGIHFKNSTAILPVDVCVVGIGIYYSISNHSKTNFIFKGTQTDTEYLKHTGVDLDAQGHVVVDSYMQTCLKHVFAGGDIVSFPLHGKRSTVGHWQMAQSQGRVAALNVLGIETQLNTVPYFWSMFFGKGLRFAGHTDNVKDPVITGDVDNFKFTAYFFTGSKVSAVASMGQDEVPAMFANLSKDGLSLSEEEVRRDPLEWIRVYKEGSQVTRF